ncbi:sigma-70 family RNA polymerase sigma factor [Mucilaginibacter sp. PAMB04274]|uniref:RNA polymerase sigma factor n=1 Tax=Mucilaginibacter sp. PAMB04274 TaxID=3138568 RepID=UPI0031F6AFFD
MIKDEDVAKELLQDLFLKLWTKRTELNVEKPLQPYLYKMASRLAYNHFRKIAQDQRLISQLILTTVDHVTNIEDTLIDEETQALLRQAIDHLPTQRKKVFTLCKLEGKSYDEVSNTLGISNATINEHVVKANKAIKQYFWANYSMTVIVVVLHLIDH